MIEIAIGVILLGGRLIMNRAARRGLMLMLSIVFVCTFVPFSTQSQQLRSGNPIIPGWYADPEAHVFRNEYWIYPTYSARYEQQVFFDAFSSKDRHLEKTSAHLFER